MSPKMSFGLGHKKPRESASGEAPSPIASAFDQAGLNLAARAASASLVGCLVLSPLGLIAGGLALWQSAASAAPPPAASAVDRSNDRAVAGEMARTVVVTWLTTTRDHPEPLTSLVKGASVSTLPLRAFVVTDPAVAGITELDASVWSVVIAATVTDARNSTNRRFYQVPVKIVNGNVAALSLPAPITGPVHARVASDAEYRHQVDRASNAGQAVDQFLAAYGAGQGDVSRYLTPGIALQAITPAPYTGVRLDDLRAATEIPVGKQPADRDWVRVLVTASMTVTEEQTLPVMYALTLTARAGRWEVSAIDQVPATSNTPAAQATGSAHPVGDPAAPSRSATARDASPASTPHPTSTR